VLNLICATSTYGLNLWFLGSIQAGVDKLFCHDLSPFFDATLECPELTMWKNPGMFPLKATEELFRCGVRVTL
jgi:hypothetical protein